MSKIAIVFWSGTGNTQIMADEIKAGAESAGAEVDVFGPTEFNAEMIAGYTAFAFGCPSMGLEVLEEDEYEPMFIAVEHALSGKKVGLFGSYGWGDGQWMREWVERCQKDGIDLMDDEGLILNETPDDAGRKTCREFGVKLAN